MLKKIFGKKNHTLESLTADFHRLETRKQELTDEVAALKKSAFKGAIDTPKLVDALQKLELELSLLEPAQAEIKSLMGGILERENEAEYKSLPGLKKKNQVDFDKHTRQAGDYIGRAVLILESIEKSSITPIAKAIRRAILAQTEVQKFADDLRAFEAGYIDRMNAAESLPNFKKLRLDIDAIAERAPGSEAATMRIESTIRRLLAQ